jgi:hypothetical protein
VLLFPVVLSNKDSKPVAVLLIPVVLLESAVAPSPVLPLPVVFDWRAPYPSAVSFWQLVQWDRALVPAAVLKPGLALLTTGSVPGVAPAATHDCVEVKVPAEQEVELPTMLKPALHVIEQAVPEAMTELQLPKLPFVGALTAQGFGAHVCAVNTPVAEQEVVEPWRL